MTKYNNNFTLNLIQPSNQSVEKQNTIDYQNMPT